MSDQDDQIRIYVSPEPTAEELAAISAAVAAVASHHQNGNGDEEAPAGGGRERWAQAGRREVLRAGEWSINRTW